MKHLIILRKQYSKLLMRELVIMLMIVFILFSLLGALSPLFHAILSNRYVSSSLPDNTIYFYPSDRVLTSIMMSDTEAENGPQQSMEKQIDSISDEITASGVGQTTDVYMIGSDGSNTGRDTVFIGYNDDLIDFASLPLEQGTWLSEHKQDEAVPIVVGGAFRDKDHMRVGEHMTVCFAADDSKTDCVVAGILNKDDMYFNISSGETDISTYSIASLYKWEQEDTAAFDNGIIIFPSSRVGNRLSDYSPGYLFFFDEGQNPSSQANILSYLNKYGHSSTIPEMMKNRYLRTVSVNNSDVVTSFSLFVFCILGLGGYTILMLEKNARVMQIYRICGMTKTYGTGIKIFTVALLVVLPSGLTLTRLQGRLEAFWVLNGVVYLCFVAALILILLPSIIYCICTDKHQTMMRRKE